ncbi:MAG TPA: outer-membrane lipoprotein carrier protein LolA [Spirochaetota bacterium]|nr:outer-membrane lipoprotein carrier protein LolA [Spirochaetota bacterium]
MKRIFLLCPLLLLLAVPLFAQEVEIDIVSINDIKNLMSERFSSIEDYTANFTWVNGDVKYSGIIKYKKPDNILLEFDEPEEQKIVSNGRVLYIYIPYLKVVCQQSLGEDTESSILSTTSESGLSKLFEDYSFSFFDTSALQQFGKNKAYHLKLTQKRPKVGFKEMDFWVAGNGLILQSNGISPNGVKVSLTFSNIQLNVELPDYIFDFEVPADAQIIRNIIVPF